MIKFILLLFPVLAFAQVESDPSWYAILNQYITQYLIPLMSSLAIKYPITVVIFTVMGVARMFIKPIFAAYENYVASTPSKDDDLKLEAAKKKLWFKIIQFIVDYIFSIKIK